MYKFRSIQKNTLAGCEIPERMSEWRVVERERNLKFYVVVLLNLLSDYFSSILALLFSRSMKSSMAFDFIFSVSAFTICSFTSLRPGRAGGFLS